MSHYQRNFKYELVFLFSYLSLLIYYCYGTDIECTCAINSGNFCPACEANLYLYSPTQKIADNDGESVEIEICEKCEEISTDKICHVKMNMDKKCLCPRCSLEYLSYYFPRQAIETTKSYCAKLIFNDLIKDKTVRNTTKIVIDDLVNEKFNKNIRILKE